MLILGLEQRQIPQWLRILLLWIASSVLLGALTALAPVSHRTSDPRPALLVSQAILQKGTIRLDAYEGSLSEPLADNYRVFEHSGHYYYFYPLGSSLLALPFVWIANLAGFDMAMDSHDSAVQLFIGALTLGLTSTLLYLIGRSYLNRPQSAIIAIVFVLGSSIISTMGTAMWSINFAVVFILLTLWLIVRADTGRSAGFNPYVLGALLFAAYFSRPSTAIFILATLLYLFWCYRPLFWRTALAALALFLLFLLANWLEFGRPLPEYQANALFLGMDTAYLTAVYGLLFSPSRGLFVFSPMILLATLGAILALVRRRRNHLIVFCLIWISLQILLLPLLANWWGGWSYGPRLLTELVPGVALMTILAWRELSSEMRPGRRLVAAGSFLILGLLAIFFHTWQGLYNTNTVAWNVSPNVDSHPENVLDWRYPQFAATSRMLCRRSLEFAGDWLREGAIELVSYELGEHISYDPAEGNVFFAGWSVPEDGFRWSECPSAAIFFKLDSAEPGRSYRLEVSAGSFGPQEVSVTLNGESVGHMNFEEHRDPVHDPASFTISFDGLLLRPGEINELAFHIPGAARPGNGDERELGVSFVSATIDS